MNDAKWDRLEPTFSLEDDRLSELKKITPEAFTDGKVDFERLRELLGERSRTNRLSISASTGQASVRHAASQGYRVRGRLLRFREKVCTWRPLRTSLSRATISKS
jgi:hypothetical protein